MAEQRITAKQERFARTFVQQGCSAADAYRAAYDCAQSKPATVQRRAHELLANSKIAAMVAELRARANAAVVVTLNGHLRDLQELRDQARMAGAYGPAVRAEEARGKAAGLVVEKREHRIESVNWEALAPTRDGDGDE